MSFLDRFKPQPRWKHADPVVRATAVAEVPDDDEHRGVLAELAADEDVHVRRAAMTRLEDIEVLVRLARTEPEAGLREELSERLVGLATGADAVAAVRALDGLDDQKHFATVAQSSPHDGVRASALGRVHDVKTLGSIARKATHPQTALEAVARIADPAELLNIAMKTEHKDAGISALERTAAALTEGYVRETLEVVSARAKSKGVSKRARVMVQAIDERAAARRQALEQWQHRLAAVLARIEGIAAAPGSPDARIDLANTEGEWSETSADGRFELDPETAARFGVLVESARTAIVAREHEEAERRAAAERQEAARAARAALCERVEQARAEDAPDAIDRARAEWEGLAAPSQTSDDDRLAARFEHACRRAAERHQNRQEIQKVNARLDELSAEAERTSLQDGMPEEAWTAIQREWQSLQSSSDSLDAAVTERYAAAEGRVRQRAEEQRAAAERTARQQVQRVEQLIDRASKRATAEDFTLREADRLARELRTAIDASHSRASDAPGAPAPRSASDREQQMVVDRLKAALTAVSSKLHELREMDEWKRFANAAVQEELIAKTEALRAKYGFDSADGVKPDDLDKVARELHDIQERWKLAAEAPRAQAQALWHRYRQAADPIQTKVREFFALRGEERKANLDHKLALVERAEALADSTDWIKTADELKKLQAEWQAIGSVPRQDTRATWKRFREACDRFFTRRNTDLAERKEAWAGNLARKEALCVRAEELATSTAWDTGAAEIRRLQAEWKTVGSVRRNKSEVMWQRFRTACDTFFDRYKRRDQIELEGKQADREALVSELESLGPIERSDATSEPAPEGVTDSAPTPPVPIDNAALLEHVRSLRSRWNQSSPAVRQGADPLSARFMGALERLTAAYPDAFLGTELDVEANRVKMDKLCARVEEFLTGAAVTPSSSSQALATMLREALAANTIGGRAGEESKWKAMAEDVRQAQAAWSRLGPVTGDRGRQLADRFHKACSRFFDQYRRHVPQESQPQRSGRPVGVR
jgi:uncharacterized protein DUF349